jgi:hypothetical protein
MNWHKNLREESMKFIIRTAAIAATSLLFLTTPALAAVTGLTFAGGCPESADDATCNNPGNATVENVSILVGAPVFQVTSGFTINGLAPPATDDLSDFINTTSGTWAVTDPLIEYLAFKADGFFILAQVDAAGGLWSTTPSEWNVTTTACPAGICNDSGTGSSGPADRMYTEADFLNGGSSIAEISNVRAFSTVPVPAAVWLFGSGLGLLGWMRRKSIVAK